MSSASTATDAGATVPTPAPRGRRDSRVRLIVGYAAIVAVLPYFLLKAAWIAGSTIGITGASSIDAAVVQGGNIATAALEIGAIGIILLFTHAWGARVPAFLVLAPTWVGTGLLAPFVITGPVVAASVLIDSSAVGDGSMAPWVGPLVYLSFGAQAIGIAASFVLYARDRWPQVLTGRVRDRPPGLHQPVVVLFSLLVTTLLVIVAAARLSWAFGATWGLSTGLVESRGLAERLADAGTASFAVAAAAALLALAFRRPPRLRTAVPLALGWVGGGAVFGSGLYSMVLLLAGVAGSGMPTTQTGLVPFVDLLQLLAGTVIAVVGAFVLAESHARGDDHRH
ncbi:hypothetical protein FHR81_001867 [Actinoalloteichus hoggarensis]|uniref:Uncharacterized protein n=1 Tax=Actinoalloteichus hoggarensis TaxID=1470176 RepID=A0A221W4X2_9PSEU|nr:hypothetical protein [Actinoalloteichus hoggarensis]ASO20898.1 hypothetical protein AHOG_16360 [Actinoalloteichus hoggarensis]MBB5920829.1 hypothetical protein [Actinoalloteichus hoggarensis]